MKIVFAGSPEFALPALKALLNSPHKICAVYTQPDRPSGRGQKLTANPVKQFALANNLPVYQPLTLKDLTVQKQLQDFNIDIFVDVAYGLLLPENILVIPKFGCINIHPSLLPRFRGAAPIQRAIIAGDTVTGVTIMKMDMELDTGDIYKQESLSINDKDTTETLMKKTSEIGAKLLLEVLSDIEKCIAKTIPQNHKLSTYADKISKEEGKINWHKSAKEIDRMIRAFNPWPIAYTEIDDQYIRIWQAEIKTFKEVILDTAPGTILNIDKSGIDVITGEGVLRLLKLQFPGKKPLTITDILNSNNKIFVIGRKFFS